MKKSITTLCAAAIVLMAGSQVFAAGNTGCGLGTSIWKGKSGLVFEIMALSTNGTLFNQSFGITIGTLGCDGSNHVVYDARVERFISANMDNLANDIARGEGEYLNTLAILLEVQEGDMVSFCTLLRENFSHIYTSENVTAADVARNIDHLRNS